MTPMPSATQSGTRLYNSIPSVFGDDESTGWFGVHFAEAIMAMLQKLDQIVQDSPAGVHPITGAPVPGMRAHPGWSAIVDPTTCPNEWLPWCATLYGVSLVGYTNPAEQREQILLLAPQKRGSTASMLAAAEATLTGKKEVFFVEQSNGESYVITAHTEASETPSEAKTREALLSQKPGGVVLVYSASSTPTWAEALKKWNEVSSTVTWANVKTGQV
jgi:hypothetical protein